MAADCTPATLMADAKCLLALSPHELLAYIAWQLAINAGVTPTPANLAARSACLRNADDHQLLADIAYLQCAATAPS